MIVAALCLTVLAGSAGAVGSAGVGPVYVSGIGIRTQPPAWPTWSPDGGKVWEGSTLSAVPGTWTGTGTISFGYEWFHGDDMVPLAQHVGVGSTYTVSGSDVGWFLWLRVTATDASGSSWHYSSPVGRVVYRPPRMLREPRIVGYPVVGNTLVVDHGDWDLVGAAAGQPITYGYWWWACYEWASPDPVSGQTGDCNTLERDPAFSLPGDGATIPDWMYDPTSFKSLSLFAYVLVSIPDGAGGIVRANEPGLLGGRVTNATEPIMPRVTQNIAAGQTLTGTVTWTATPSGPVAQVVFALDGNKTTVTDTSAPYEYVLDTTRLANGNHKLGLTVTTMYGDRVVWEPYQIGTVTVANAPTTSAPVNTGPPLLSGTAQLGRTLTGTDGAWTGTSPISYARQWQSCSGGDCSDIAAATGSSYAPNAADVGKTLRLRVTARNLVGSVSAESAASAVVLATGSGGGAGGGGGSGGGGSGSADLYLTGSVEPAAAPVSGTITWRLRAADDKNYGPATGVMVDVTLPAGVSVVSATTDRGSGCATSGAGTLRCNLDWLSSDAPYGNIVIVTNVTAAGELVLGATIGYSQADSVSANNALTLTANAPVVVTPPPSSPKLPAVVRPVLGKPLAQPARPLAGKRFTLTLPVKRSDTQTPLTGGRMVCDPTLAGKSIKHNESFTGGKALLSLVVPRAATGKQLKVRIKITASGQTATRLYTYKVR